MPKCVLAQAKCPRTNDPMADKYCPMWQEQAWKNAHTGEVKMRKECGVNMLFESISAAGNASRHAMREASTISNILSTAARGISNDKRRIEADYNALD